MKRVSIKHIAEKLGIFHATVSFVLSGKATGGGVDKEIVGVFFSVNRISVIGIKEMLHRGIPIPCVKYPIAGMGCKAADILIEQITRKDMDTNLVMCRLSARLIS